MISPVIYFGVVFITLFSAFYRFRPNPRRVTERKQAQGDSPAVEKIIPFKPGQCLAQDKYGIYYPPLAGEKFVLVEGEDELMQDRILAALTLRPDVMNVLKTQQNRISA